MGYSTTIFQHMMVIQTIICIINIMLVAHIWRIRATYCHFTFLQLCQFIESSFDPAGRCLPQDLLRDRNWYEAVVLSSDWPDSEFKRTYRIDRRTFNYILQAIEADVTAETDRPVFGRMPLTPHHKLCIFLYRLSRRSALCTDIAVKFGVSDSTVCRVTDEVSDAIIRRLGHIIYFPETPQAMKQKFKLNRKILRAAGDICPPGVIGFIDGSYIPIFIFDPLDPAARNSYFNRKSFFAMTLQLVVDSSGFIMDVFFGYPSRQPDATVLRASRLGKVGDRIFGQSGVRKNGLCKYYIIGDAGYPIRPWLLPPYKRVGQLNERHYFFNRVVSVARVKVENVFAALKGRWRRLKLLDVELERTNNMVFTACILHNICIAFQDPVPERNPDDADDVEDDDQGVDQNDDEIDNDDDNDPLESRNNRLNGWRNNIRDRLWLMRDN